ncbi:uncharacterized protein LOC141778770 isoform X2 [Sebastes fasciatus]|uniref:uncharacterized protein LOC141778770 isoform X2 n=1 Tax=Sebastes fasciatus TaxID=394691 RepID=UPI003D9EFBD2
MQGRTPANFQPFPVVHLKERPNLLFEMPLSSGVVSAIVIAVMLLLVIMAAVVYLVFIRRRHPMVRHHVYIDTGGPVMDVARPSVLVRDEDVVYSDVKRKPFRDTTPSSNEEHSVDDVTYSEVVVWRQQPKCTLK